MSAALPGMLSGAPSYIWTWTAVVLPSSAEEATHCKSSSDAAISSSAAVPHRADPESSPVPGRSRYTDKDGQHCAPAARENRQRKAHL